MEIIRFIQAYIGARDFPGAPLSHEQWEKVTAEAIKQSLIGIVNHVMLSLPPELQPVRQIKLNIAYYADIIAHKNALLDRHAEEISAQMQELGVESCILKGQGFAGMYPRPGDRACGDIDLWVKGSTGSILSILRKRWKVGKVFYHHAGIDAFSDGTEVEVHFRPTWMNDPFTDRKLQKYFREQAGRQFSNRPGGLGFSIPDNSFNCVFCAIHIYRHLLSEGVGLRQVMDYYYILRRSTHQERIAAARILADLKMKRFTGALMYVLREWFLLDEVYFIMPENVEYGRFLLKEIMLSGNFGKYDPRYSIKQADPMPLRAFKKLSRLRHYLPIASSEVLWAPFFKTWQYVWSKAMGLKS